MSTPGTKRLTKFPKKSACAIIMFKRLFGQPSGSVTRGGGSRGGDGRSTGSTSTGRAAFDAVDKLKDVRLLCPVKSFSLSENPPFKRMHGNPKSL